MEVLSAHDAGRGSRAHRRPPHARSRARAPPAGVPPRPREISRVPESELRFLAEAGRLKDLPGVGDTTATVIAEALAGDDAGVPAEVAQRHRRRRAAQRARRCGRGSRATCTCTPTGRTAATRSARWPSKARALGHEYFALTDHSPRLKIAHGLTADRLREQLDVVAELNEEMKPFRILTGHRSATSSKTARSTGRKSCSRASTWWWRASTPSCGWRPHR